MAKGIKKELNLAEVQKIDDSTYGTKEVKIKGYTLIMDKKFRATKMRDLVREMAKTTDYIKKNEIDIESIDFMSYGYILMIKYFTSLDIPDTFGGQMKALTILIDNDLFAGIVNNFDEKQVDILKLYIESASNNINAALAEMELDAEEEDAAEKAAEAAKSEMIQ